MPVLCQVPVEAVRVDPACAVPEIVGAAVFVGTAAAAEPMIVSAIASVAPATMPARRVCRLALFFVNPSMWRSLL